MKILERLRSPGAGAVGVKFLDLLRSEGMWNGCCDWCGKRKPDDQLRISLRQDPRQRLIVLCLSCRAREAVGQLDSHGRATFAAGRAYVGQTVRPRTRSSDFDIKSSNES